MTNQIRTPEDIEKLKKDWKHDPIWDIENTLGFEAHHDELLAWRKDYEARLDLKWKEAEDERIEKVMNETGIGKVSRNLLLSIHTWSDIAIPLQMIERGNDDSLINVQIQQVYATLLQAAQLKRIADALESMEDGDSLSNSVKIFGS